MLIFQQLCLLTVFPLTARRWGVHFLRGQKTNQKTNQKRPPDIALTPRTALPLWRGRKLMRGVHATPPMGAYGIQIRSRRICRYAHKFVGNKFGHGCARRVKYRDVFHQTLDHFIHKVSAVLGGNGRGDGAAICSEFKDQMYAVNSQIQRKTYQ